MQKRRAPCVLVCPQEEVRCRDRAADLLPFRACGWLPDYGHPFRFSPLWSSAVLQSFHSLERSLRVRDTKNLHFMAERSAGESILYLLPHVDSKVLERITIQLFP